MSAVPLSLHGNAPCFSPWANSYFTYRCLHHATAAWLGVESNCAGKPQIWYSFGQLQRLSSGPMVLLSESTFQSFTCSNTGCGDATFLPNGKLMVCFWFPPMGRHPQAESTDKFNPGWRPQEVLSSWKPRVVMVETGQLHNRDWNILLECHKKRPQSTPDHADMEKRSLCMGLACSSVTGGLPATPCETLRVMHLLSAVGA